MSEALTCLNCTRSDREVPMLSVTFRGQQVSICTSCLPVMIHKPHELAGKLPGAQDIDPGSHAH